MSQLRYCTPLLLSIIILYGCSTPKERPSSFITTLGKDTLVIEQFTMQPGKVSAEVLIRSPRTRYMSQNLGMNANGSFKEFTSLTFDPKALDAEALEIQTIKIVGDSLLITHQKDTVIRILKLAYEPTLVPWYDMVHWPYEVATRKMIKNGNNESDQLMLTGRRAATFEIRTIKEDSISIKHPFRGTMYARIDKEGGLQYYDATATTRKLTVKRGGPVDMKALAQKYADSSIGSLSGQGETNTTVYGADIAITFGQPARRGRDLFGGIVPWNERWRTGANRATHFKTSKDLLFGELAMPAGEYTLFTIPAPEGGTLIINKQTGQNGRSYDETQDLGRIPMTIVKNNESVELFTIVSIERDGKGVLQLMWGETVFEVDFMVEN